MKIENEGQEFKVRKKILDTRMTSFAENGIHPRHAKEGDLQKKALQVYASNVATENYRFSYQQCPACDGSEFTMFAEVDRYGNKCPTVSCAACGLIQTQPMPNDGTLSDFYANLYTQMYRGVKEASAASFEHPAALKVKFVERLKNSRILSAQSKEPLIVEAGCGDGSVLDIVAKNFPTAKTVGFDFDNSYMGLGRSRGLDLRQGRFVDDESIKDVDVLYYHHVFEHIRDLKQELEDIVTVLSPTGYLVIVVPGIFNILSSNRGDVLEKLQNAHLYYFDLASLVELVAPYGFELITGNEGIFSVFRKSNSDVTSHNFPKAVSATVFPRALRQEQRLLYLAGVERLFVAKLGKSVSVILDHLLRHVHPYTGKVSLSLDQLVEISGRHEKSIAEAMKLAEQHMGLVEVEGALSIDLNRVKI